LYVFACGFFPFVVFEACRDGGIGFFLKKVKHLNFFKMISFTKSYIFLNMSSSSSESLQDALCAKVQTLIENTPFSCSGVVHLDDDKRPPPLLVLLPAKHSEDEDETQGIAVCVPVSKLPQRLDLLKRASKSKFRNERGEDVLDETYRTATEFKADEFLLDHVDLDELDILNKTAFMLHLDRDRLSARRFKLCIYQNNGFFKKHQDTPVNETMIGTLVVCLNVPFEGGALNVKRVGYEQKNTFDWASVVNETTMAWGVFYGDCEHDIEPVTNGLRVTMTFQLFYNNISYPDVIKNKCKDASSSSSSSNKHQQKKAIGDDDSVIPTIPLDLCCFLEELIRNGGGSPSSSSTGTSTSTGTSSLNKSKTKKSKTETTSDISFLQYECVHEYPLKVGDRVVHMGKCLRGVDRIVYETLKRTALPEYPPMLFLHNDYCTDWYMDTAWRNKELHEKTRDGKWVRMFSEKVTKTMHTQSSYDDSNIKEEIVHRQLIVFAGPSFLLKPKSSKPFRYDDWIHASTGNGGIETSHRYQRLVMVCPTIHIRKYEAIANEVVETLALNKYVPYKKQLKQPDLVRQKTLVAFNSDYVQQCFKVDAEHSRMGTSPRDAKQEDAESLSEDESNSEEEDDDSEEDE